MTAFEEGLTEIVEAFPAPEPHSPMPVTVQAIKDAVANYRGAMAADKLTVLVNPGQKQAIQDALDTQQHIASRITLVASPVIGPDEGLVFSSSPLPKLFHLR